MPVQICLPASDKSFNQILALIYIKFNPPSLFCMSFAKLVQLENALQHLEQAGKKPPSAATVFRNSEITALFQISLSLF